MVFVDACLSKSCLSLLQKSRIHFRVRGPEIDNLTHPPQTGAVKTPPGPTSILAFESSNKTQAPNREARLPLRKGSRVDPYVIPSRRASPEASPITATPAFTSFKVSRRPSILIYSAGKEKARPRFGVMMMRVRDPRNVEDDTVCFFISVTLVWMTVCCGTLLLLWMSFTFLILNLA